MAEPAEASIYVSSEQWIHRRRGLIIRSAVDDPANLVPVIRREIQALDPLLTAEVDLYPELVRSSLARERLGMTLLVIFAMMAGLLAVVGIYGVMSYSVTQRSGEIAVRSALGASASEIMTDFLQQGVTLALAGVLLGVGAAFALRRVVASQLYGLAALDPVVFALSAVALFAVAAFGCLVPAIRATRLDPAHLLRIE
jgi:ABC-type antimicrobial peptide transport system permease subunit